MMQKLAPSVSAGDVVLLLVIALSLLPIGAAGERFALAGTLYAGWLAMSAGRSQHDLGGQPGRRVVPAPSRAARR